MPIPRSVWLPRAANRFRVYRDVSGLTQQQLAKESGVGIRTISNLEAGRSFPSAELCMKIGGPLGVENLAAKLLEE